VPAAGSADTIIAFFPSGVAILAAFELVEAAVWPRRLAAIGILARSISLPVKKRRQRQEAGRGGD